MSTEPLPTEVQASYSVIIDEILRASDLNTISAKRIRKGLQERIGHDTSSQKVRLTCIHRVVHRLTLSLGCDHRPDHDPV